MRRAFRTMARGARCCARARGAHRTTAVMRNPSPDCGRGRDCRITARHYVQLQIRAERIKFI